MLKMSSILRGSSVCQKVSMRNNTCNSFLKLNAHQFPNFVANGGKRRWEERECTDAFNKQSHDIFLKEFTCVV